MARLQEGHDNPRFVAYIPGKLGQFNLAIPIHTFNAFKHTASSIYTHSTKALERCKHYNGTAKEAELMVQPVAPYAGRLEPVLGPFPIRYGWKDSFVLSTIFYLGARRLAAEILRFGDAVPPPAFCSAPPIHPESGKSNAPIQLGAIRRECC